MKTVKSLFTLLAAGLISLTACATKAADATAETKR